ncbi:unnamed protein product [Ilex paraguariensis]|uniref:Uncharacterized protein n=1 Tax=Ilex paraguariensis TaxID=185542 RepID=A0ABC8U7W9_9AQUA
MKATSEAEGLLEMIRPPRLEDAGLEDCALPPESIQEAFLKAAMSVKSQAASVFYASDDESEANSVNDPQPNFGESPDALVGVMQGTEPPGSSDTKKGRVVVPEVVSDEGGAGVGDAKKTVGEVVGPVVPEGVKACVDGLQGLEIGREGPCSEG